MISYRLSPYVNFIENRLIPGVIQHGVSHRLTGEVLEPGERIRSLLLVMQTGSPISLSEENLNSFGEDGRQLKQLIEKEFLIPDGYDPFTRFMDHYVTRPIQNPALVYRSQNGALSLVRTSMAHHMFSPRTGELPEIIEEAILKVGTTIVKYAEKHYIELIVVGTRGKSRFKKLLIGSVASDVVSYAQCPVMVVK